MILALAAIPLLLALFLWALFDLEKFVVFGVLGAIIFPASLARPAGTNIAAVDILMVFALVAWLMSNSIGRAPDPWIRKNPILVPAVLFLAVNVLSLAWSVNPKETIVFAVQLAELVVAFPLVFATIPTSITRLRKGLTLFVVLSSGQAVAAILTWMTSASAREAGVFLPGLNKNALGSFLAAGMLVGYALMRGRRGPVLLGYGVMTALQLVGLASTGSRGAMLGAGVGVIVVAFALKHQRPLAVGGVVIMLTLYLGVLAPQHAANTAHAGAYTSASVRDIAWSDAIHKIEQNPWLGTGGKTYYDTIKRLGIGLPDPDNLFLLTWAELGIPGLVALIFLLYRFVTLFGDVTRLPPEAATLGVAAGAVVVSLLVHFQIDVSWSRGETTIEFAMMGLMLALVRLSQPEVVAAEVQNEVATALAERTVPRRLAAGGEARANGRA